MVKVLPPCCPTAFLCCATAIALLALPVNAQELDSAPDTDPPQVLPPQPEPEPQPPAEPAFTVEAVPEKAPQPPAEPAFSIETVAEAPVDNEFLDMDLSALLDVQIESVSKKTEKTKDAPLSASVVSREEIRRSGARTIMEALRLAPGLIVREQTAGNYDIHIRGLDNVPPGTQLHDFTSTTLLVMIDYRVVYNYYQGGTFWETLPIDVQDVERIEIIRGPAAALYGPNAVTGVINIITRRPKKTGFYTSNRVQYGPRGDERLAGVAAGYNFGPVSFVLSGNYHHADRSQTSYYSYETDTWIDDPLNMDSAMMEHPLTRPYDRFPRLDLATDRLGANAVISVTPLEKLRIDLSGGYQNSRVQKAYGESWSTPLSTNDSESYYADLRAQAAGLSVHASYQAGHLATPRGIFQKSTGTNVREYGFGVFDGELEYNFQLWNDRLSIRPGGSFRRAEYDGLLIADHRWTDNRIAAGNLETTDSTKALQNLAGSLRGDLLLFDRLRLIAGLRLDYYFDRTEDRYYERTPGNMDPTQPSTPTTKDGTPLWPSFQLGSTLRLTDEHLLRVTYGRAHRAPFLISTYFNDDYNPPTTIRGNRALELLTSDAVELGYRGKVLDGLELDTEVFYSYTRNFSETYAHARGIENGLPVYYEQFDNIDTVAHQAGATLSALITLSRFQSRVFVTAQKTVVDHHAPLTMHLFDFEYDPRDPANQKKLTHTGTPDLYGGLTLNAQPVPKLNFNASLYCFSHQTQVRADEIHGIMKDATYEPSVYEIEAKAILNAKISYAFAPGLRGFLSGYNLLFESSPEFFYSDRVDTSVMLGAEYDY